MSHITSEANCSQNTECVLGQHMPELVIVWQLIRLKIKSTIDRDLAVHPKKGDEVDSGGLSMQSQRLLIWKPNSL